MGTSVFLSVPWQVEFRLHVQCPHRDGHVRSTVKFDVHVRRVRPFQKCMYIPSECNVRCRRVLAGMNVTLSRWRHGYIS